MTFKCDAREAYIFQKNLRRSRDGVEVQYLCLSDIAFDDTYSLPSLQNLQKPEEFGCVDLKHLDEAPDIIIRVPNEEDNGTIDFGLSREEFFEMATKRLVTKTWQDYEIQELIIAKDFLNKSNVNFFCDPEKGTIRSTMQTRNESREKNNTEKGMFNAFVEQCDKDKQMTITELAHMFEEFASAKNAKEQKEVVEFDHFVEEHEAAGY